MNTLFIFSLLALLQLTLLLAAVLRLGELSWKL